MPPQRRAAVLGQPVAHSLSPLLHQAAYDELGLDWRYDAIDIGAQELAGFVAGLGPEWAGLSLTRPLKEVALALLDSRSELVEVTEAVNTLVLEGGVPTGHNTDVSGIAEALAETSREVPASAVVLGGGATGRSALAALAYLGCRDVTLVTRSVPTLALATAQRLDLRVRLADWDPPAIRDADLVISTVPPGAADAFAPYAGDVALLLEVIYDPWPTPLVSGCGGVVVAGTTMLLHQAAAQVSLMTGLPAPLEAMRAALAGGSRT